MAAWRQCTDEDAEYCPRSTKKIRKMDEREEFYNKYAICFDSSKAEPTGYSEVQDYMAGLLKKYLSPSEELILDVGCGTGIGGLALQKAGFKKLHGIHAYASDHMLKSAEDKGIYLILRSVIISENEKFACDDDEYGGVYSVSVTSRGQLDLKRSIEEFCRIVKPGGYAAFTINWLIKPYQFMPLISEIVVQKRAEVLLIEKRFYWTLDNVDHDCYCCLLRVL